jgi:two-component system nitrogen regulation response regulator NtrX
MAQKILVVDDEPSSRKSLCLLLEEEGYDARQAASGEEAMEMLADEPFNLVITDFVMPHGHGLQLVDVLHTLYPKLPVVLLTGYLSASTGDKIMSGKAEIVEKPFNVDEMLSTVRRLLTSLVVVFDALITVSLIA